MMSLHSLCCQGGDIAMMVLRFHLQKDDNMRTRLKVKEVAQEKGISMTKLHKTSDVAYGTIRKIFREPYTEVTLTTLNRIAVALGVEVKDLLESVPDDNEE